MPTIAATAAATPKILPGDRFDAIVVGAGFAGLYMLYRLRQAGFSARVFEAAPDVGGTWYWNRYPGARCDIESMQYSYQFDEALQQEWEWKERYAAQPEILAYIRHVAERYDLRPDIQFDTRVEAATFDEEADEWVVETDAGQTVRARYFVMGVGCLSTTITPHFEGYDDYEGPIYHTGLWPTDGVDFTGKRVGIIGTGSSAIQAIPLIAEEAERLYVFQRTPNYVVPAQNVPLDPEKTAELKADYKGFRARAKTRPTAFLFPFHTDSALSVSAEERDARFESQWKIGGLPFLGAFGDILTNEESNETVTEFWKKKIREVVKDPETAEKLTPKGDVFGCKRLCSGTNYYETFNRDNVELVDVSGAGIKQFTRKGLIAEGEEYELDAIICATGFDAMTGSVTRIRIAGLGGQTIQEKWAGGPDNYLGMTVSGFPNMFNMAGPGSPSVLATMVTAAEQHAEWISGCMEWMRENGKTRIDAKRDAELGWVEEVNKAAEGSLRSTCNSWYVGSNVPGKARVFMPYIGGFPSYVEKCEAEAKSGYAGFTVSG
jgi:cation diffusion facilitator CzcD-associated flavoprotein CzcO